VRESGAGGGFECAGKRLPWRMVRCKAADYESNGRSVGLPKSVMIDAQNKPCYGLAFFPAEPSSDAAGS
jgi:hypothetical protein